MRKIISREERERKSRRNMIIVGILLISVMLFGTIGYAFSGRDEGSVEKVNYKEIEFIQRSSGYWEFNIQGYGFATRYNPEETGDIPILSYKFINDYAGKPLYFVGDYSEPKGEIIRNLNSFYSYKVENTCLVGENCSGDFPVKNCTSDNIIIIRAPEDDKMSIYQEDNCIYILADFQNQTRYTDAFLFKILGL